MSEYLVPILIGVLAAALIYRRLRRFFGRHKISVPGFIFRMSLAGIIAAVFIVLPGEAIGFRILGFSIGLILALIGVMTTKLDKEGDQWFYTPNLYLGLAILSLFLGRIIYRLSMFFKLSEASRTDFDMSQVLTGNPIGRVVLIVLLMYFAVYHAGVLYRYRSKSRAIEEPMSTD